MISTLDKVIDIVSEESGKPRERVSLETTLLGDLALDGDDAWAVIDRLHQDHGVDFSRFEFQKHFRNEPCLKGPLYLIRKLRFRDEHIAARKTPITVAKLVEALEKRKWLVDE